MTIVVSLLFAIALNVQATRSPESSGRVCIAAFTPPSKDQVPSEPTMSVAHTTWAPGEQSTFSFQFDQRAPVIVSKGQSMLIEALPLNQELRIKVRLDDQPFESFVLRLDAETPQRCLWFYPGYWHWVDNGWEARLGCDCAI